MQTTTRCVSPCKARISVNHWVQSDSTYVHTTRVSYLFPNSTVPQQPLALLAHLLHPLDPEPWPRLEVWVSCHRVRRSKVLVTSRPQQLCAHLRGSNLGGISRENVCGR